MSKKTIISRDFRKQFNRNVVYKKRKKNKKVSHRVLTIFHALHDRHTSPSTLLISLSCLSDNDAGRKVAIGCVFWTFDSCATGIIPFAEVFSDCLLQAKGLYFLLAVCRRPRQQRSCKGQTADDWVKRQSLVWGKRRRLLLIFNAELENRSS